MAMSRTAKEMIRLNVIALIAFLLLGALTWLAHVAFPSSIATIVLIPFYLLWFLVVVAFWGIGPLGKRLKQAGIEDAKEQQREHAS